MDKNFNKSITDRHMYCSMSVTGLRTIEVLLPLVQTKRVVRYDSPNDRGSSHGLNIFRKFFVELSLPTYLPTLSSVVLKKRMGVVMKDMI